MPPSRGKDRGRKKPRKLNVRRLLILCEDAKSSRDYLACFPHDDKVVQIECVGTGMNTDSLMEKAINMAKKAEKNGEPYEQVWVVFDRDSFPKKNFYRTFDLAYNHKTITPCWSNECFEIWYLLHFDYRDTAIDRKELRERLSQLLGKKYEKADRSLFDQLSDRMRKAIQNAKLLAYNNTMNGDAYRNPSTRVHELVELLLRFDPKTYNG